MQLASLVKEIGNNHNFDFKPSDVSSIVLSCKFADIPEEVEESNIPMVKDVIMAAMSAHSHRVLATAPVISGVASCPIDGCGKKMEKVLLINNRPAMYCTKHRVALPTEP